LRSGVITGTAAIVLAGSGAAAGAVLAQKFGRTARTDGLLAAYGVYLVLTLAAQAFRMVVVPDLTRAAGEGRLAAETRAYGLAFVALGIPAAVLVGVFHRALGDALTAQPQASEIAGRALVWLVPAAFAQLLAAVCASALAARGSYATAATGFAAGGVAGLLLFVVLANGHGVISLAWALALNGSVALAVPLAALIARGELRGGSGAPLAVGRRLWRLVQGAALPVALQGCYVIGLRLAGALGVGSPTTLSYAYVLAAMMVTSTAFALGLVTSAALTRRGLTPEGGAEHIVHAAWVSLAIVAGAAGVAALAGDRVAGLVLGDAFKGGHLGRLVVELAPFMAAWAVFSVVYPLVFVGGKTRTLVPIAVGLVALDVPIAVALRNWLGLAGIALSLAIVTGVAAFGLLAELSPRLLLLSLAGLGRMAALVGGAALLAFGLPDLVLDPVVAACTGLVLYVALLLVALRPLGLSAALAYVRTLQ
jgi:peptidoglycan biosynthesis protein MviN/MurJ (putative lipid II flippase)